MKNIQEQEQQKKKLMDRYKASKNAKILRKQDKSTTRTDMTNEEQGFVLPNLNEKAERSVARLEDNKKSKVKNKKGIFTSKRNTEFKQKISILTPTKHKYFDNFKGDLNLEDQK